MLGRHVGDQCSRVAGSPSCVSGGLALLMLVVLRTIVVSIRLPHGHVLLQVVGAHWQHQQPPRLQLLHRSRLTHGSPPRLACSHGMLRLVDPGSRVPAGSWAQALRTPTDSAALSGL